MATRKQNKKKLTTQRRAAKKRESAQEYSPLLADFIAKTDELLSICQTVKKGNVSLKSHKFYAPKGRTAYAELQIAYDALAAAHPVDQFPKLKGHLEEIEHDMATVEDSFPDNVRSLITSLAHIKLIASSDLHVALKALGAAPRKAVTIASEFIPNELLENHADVHKKILWEINVCFDKECYNAAAILIRRLVESLLVLAFEARNATSKIKNKDGDFMTLQGIIGQATASQELKLSRNAKEGLPKLKFFGDLGAHNPHARVRKGDLEKVHEAVRVTIEELAGHSLPKKKATA